VPQGDLWAGFIQKLRTVEKKANAQGGTTGQKELVFDDSWVEKAAKARDSAAEAERAKKQPRSQTAPGASSAGLHAPAPAPAPAPTARPAPALSALRFRVERPQTVTPNPDQWFQLILHDAPQHAPNQLSFSIDYRPETISLPRPRESGAPLRFQVSLPAVRIIPGWGPVTALKDSINVNNASPTVTYGMGWEVMLPQNANAWALDHFEAALLEAGAPGDKLLLSAYARREEIAVTRIDNRPANGNRDAVIAQALRKLGFEGEGDHAEIAKGAIVAEQEDKT
jgi:hypothetical protein